MGRKGVIAAALLLLLGGVVVWTSANKTTKVTTVDDLPWQITVDAQGQTEVLRLRPGETRLRAYIEQLQHFPELGIFAHRDGEPRLEAYFGKRRLGVLEARLVVELAASPEQLAKFMAESPERKAQPSGAWRYALSEAALAESNDLSIRYLIYLPVADYDAELLRQRFGDAPEQLMLTEGAAYWFYPQRGVAILLRAGGGDIFYYSAVSAFPALRQRLIDETQSGVPK